MSSTSLYPRRRRPRTVITAAATVGLLAGTIPAVATAPDGFPTTDDPRYELEAGYDAETASLGFDHQAWIDKADTGLVGTNSDLAFTGDHLLQGNYNGFHVIDVSDPADPQIRTTVVCPGSQGDLTVYGHLAFQSVEAAAGRVDCGTQGAGPAGTPNPDRMRGVRIWDLSDLDNPVQVGTVQTCRGSHTHRLVEDLDDPDNVYVYINGTAGQRHVDEAVHTPDGFVTGRCGQTDATGDNPSMWMIEIVKVPVDDPAAAEVVNEARLFEDFETGAVNGLQNEPPAGGHPCNRDEDPDAFCAPAGAAYSPNPNTNTCHDITAYPEIGLAAGACQGNGILIDISDPADPVRIDAVADENFSYWHSANFTNDGETVMFTDEWGGGGGARCAPNHRLSWGANAIFSIDRSGPTPKMVFESYYKLPVAQQNNENCVAHQANLVPVPGRDILVQAWYQGGISMFDLTDPANPFEIGYFDRGPLGTAAGGFWSAYWYNGAVYGSELTRGTDTFYLTPTDQLGEKELAAAKEVVLTEHNAMSMRQYDWAPSFNVVGAYVEQAERSGALSGSTLAQVKEHLATGERLDAGNASKRAVQAQLDNALRKVGDRDEAVSTAIRELRSTL